MSQTYDILSAQTCCFLQAKKLPTVLLKPFLHLNSTDPFRREKNLSHLKIYLQSEPFITQSFAERLRQFILNTLPLYTVVQSFDKVFYLKLPQELARTFSQTISPPFVLSLNSFPFVSFTFSEQQLTKL